jgi:hypothetical protein
VFFFSKLGVTREPKRKIHFKKWKLAKSWQNKIGGGKGIHGA